MTSTPYFDEYLAFQNLLPQITVGSKWVVNPNNNKGTYCLDPFMIVYLDSENFTFGEGQLWYGFKYLDDNFYFEAGKHQFLKDVMDKYVIPHND